MKFGSFIDKINSYQKLEKLLEEKTNSPVYFNEAYRVRLEEEIKEIIKKLEELREEEI